MLNEDAGLEPTGTGGSPVELRRQVQISKEPASRVGVGLVNLRKGVVGVAEVAANSPLKGLIFPGDIIQLGATSAAPTVGSSPDADGLSAFFFATSELSLTVETPPLRAEAQSVFLRSSELGETPELGIQVDKEPVTGRARVARLKPDSIATAAVGGNVLAPGDLIVAVSEGGTLHETSNASQVVARLKAYRCGTVELRVVRSAGSRAALAGVETTGGAGTPVDAVACRPTHTELVQMLSAGNDTRVRQRALHSLASALYTGEIAELELHAESLWAIMVELATEAEAAEDDLTLSLAFSAVANLATAGFVPQGDAGGAIGHVLSSSLIRALGGLDSSLVAFTLSAAYNLCAEPSVLGALNETHNRVAPMLDALVKTSKDAQARKQAKGTLRNMQQHRVAMAAAQAVQAVPPAPPVPLIA